MILYHPYAEALVDHPRLAATWHCLREQESTLLSRGWHIIHQPCGWDARYETGLKALWGQDDLTILEQDIEPTLDALIAMEPPHHALCAQTYRLYQDRDQGRALDAIWALAQALPFDRPETRLAHEVCAQAYTLWHQAYRAESAAPRRYFPTWAHRVVGDQGHQWISADADYADLAGFGLTRFTRAFQRVHPPGWADGAWNTLDSRVSTWTHALGWSFHIHWPAVPHHHHCPCHETADDPSNPCAPE